MEALATEVKRQAANRLDLVADTSEIFYEANGAQKLTVGKLTRDRNPQGPFTIGPVANAQIAEKLGIPKHWFDKMLAEHPNTIADVVNDLFRQAPSRRMVRTLDGRARAFLSDKYRRIDNIDVLEAILPVLAEANPLFESQQVTERKLHLKVVFPGVEAEIRKDDVVKAGVYIGNSEVGLGAIEATVMVYRMWCLNGCISETTVRRTHVGRQVQDGDDYSIFSDETRQKDDELVIAKMRDVVKAALDTAKFQALCGLTHPATEVGIEKPVLAVEALSNRFGLLETERESVLDHLIQGKDITQYGLMNAVTRHAQDVESFDRSVDLEKLGGRILGLSPDAFAVLGAESN